MPRTRRALNLVDAVIRNMGQVDILVNAQGLNKKFPAQDFDMDVFQQMLSVNVAGVMMCCKHFGKTDDRARIR